MSTKRIAALALASLMTAGTAVMAQEKANETKVTETKATQGAPRLTIVEPLKDFGTVAKGEKINWDFVVKNTGTADLQILSAQPGCGCTVTDFDKVIKPGQTGKVTAHVDTTNFTGPISKPVTLQTNDPNTPSAQVTIHALVRPFVDSYPAGFVRYSLLQSDEPMTQSITIFTEEETPLEIKNIEVPGPYVKADFKKLDEAERVAGKGRDGQAQYKIDLTVNPAAAPIGPLADKVKIVTNSTHQPEYLVSVTGLIRPTYTVTPTVLNFGDVTAADPAASRTVSFISNSKSPTEFQVTDVKVEGATANLLAATVAPTEAPGEFELTIKVATDAKAGAIDGLVNVYTNDKITPVFKLPVKGNVKAAAAGASK